MSQRADQVPLVDRVQVLVVDEHAVAGQVAEPNVRHRAVDCRRNQQLFRCRARRIRCRCGGTSGRNDDRNQKQQEQFDNVGRDLHSIHFLQFVRESFSV